MLQKTQTKQADQAVLGRTEISATFEVGRQSLEFISLDAEVEFCKYQKEIFWQSSI